jgi:hypothetical protein
MNVNSLLLENTDRTNLNEAERKLSIAAGAALFGFGLLSAGRLRGLLLTGIGAAAIYRGVTGHCHFYDAMGIDTSAETSESFAGSQEFAVSEGSDVSRDAKSAASAYGSKVKQRHTAEIKGKNQVDKDRFDKLKSTQVNRGRDEEKAIEIAAEEVKELRRREGRSKDDEANFEGTEEILEKRGNRQD